MLIVWFGRFIRKKREKNRREDKFHVNVFRVIELIMLKKFPHLRLLHLHWGGGVGCVRLFVLEGITGKWCIFFVRKLETKSSQNQISYRIGNIPDSYVCDDYVAIMC